MPDPLRRSARRMALAATLLAITLLALAFMPGARAALLGVAGAPAELSRLWLPTLRAPGEPPGPAPEPSGTTETATSTAETATSTAETATVTVSPSPETPTVSPSPETPTVTVSPSPVGPYRILVFSKTAGFRHGSIPDALAAIVRLGEANGFTVDATEDGAQFTTANLARYRAVVFLMTTGDVLSRPQEEAFEAYIRAGGGWVGVHSASDTEYTWPWYEGLVGAYFKDHPPTFRRADNVVEDRVHPSTAHLPERWSRSDEWYNFQTNPRSRVHVLISLDESTYEGGTMGDHPIAWCHAYDGGRAWYTAGGHSASAYSDERFIRHILGGIRYAAGEAGACPP